MIRKSFVFFLGFFFLFGGMFVSAQKFDFNYFLNQPDKVLSPSYPWYAERPSSVKDFLNPKNTPFRTQWQPKKSGLYYRFSRDFVRSDYERWRDIERRGFQIIDTEDIPGEYCRYRDSIIGKDFLSDADIAGRCCVCGIGGEWQCQYTHTKVGRQCKTSDLALLGTVFTEDPSFSGGDQKKFLFETVLKNQGSIKSNDFTVALLVDSVEVSSIRLEGLFPNQQITVSEKTFPYINRGIILNTGEHEISLVLSTEETEEQNTENNSYQEILTVIPPLHDFLISSVHVSRSAVQNINGETSIRFQVEVKNEGEPFSIVPESYMLEVFLDPTLPPLYSETFSEPLAAGESAQQTFSLSGEDGDYVFYVQVTPSSEFEMNEENNIFESPFSVFKPQRRNEFRGF